MTTDDGSGSSWEISRLEGWMTFPEAAEVLGVSKQMIHKMVFTTEVFNRKLDIRKIGEKPIYVVREEKISALKESRDQQHI